MNESANEWMNQQIIEQFKKQTNEWTSKLMDKQISNCGRKALAKDFFKQPPKNVLKVLLPKQMNEQTNEWMNGQSKDYLCKSRICFKSATAPNSEWTKKQINERTDKRMSVCTT